MVKKLQKSFFLCVRKILLEAKKTLIVQEAHFKDLLWFSA